MHQGLKRSDGLSQLLHSRPFALDHGDSDGALGPAVIECISFSIYGRFSHWEFVQINWDFMKMKTARFGIPAHGLEKCMVSLVPSTAHKTTFVTLVYSPPNISCPSSRERDRLVCRDPLSEIRTLQDSKLLKKSSNILCSTNIYRN